MRNLVFTTNRMGREVDSMINSCFARPQGGSKQEATFSPRADIKEDKDSFFLTFELPGMERGKIKVVVQDDILTVSGERKIESVEKSEGQIRSEIRTGSFSRSFTLPDQVDLQKVKADYNNGLLEVSIAKAEEKKPKEIEIKVG